MVALIEYWQSEEDGQWYFHLKAPYDGIIVQSVGYQSEEDCLIGIE
ncbi:MAG: YegP family protein [Candidatus Thermoplasmatota archaeon]